MPSNILDSKGELNKTPQVIFFRESAFGAVWHTSSIFYKYRLDYLVSVWPFNSRPGPGEMLICPRCWQPNPSQRLFISEPVRVLVFDINSGLLNVASRLRYWLALRETLSKATWSSPFTRHRGNKLLRGSEGERVICPQEQDSQLQRRVTARSWWKGWMNKKKERG